MDSELKDYTSHAKDLVNTTKFFEALGSPCLLSLFLSLVSIFIFRFNFINQLFQEHSEIDLSKMKWYTVGTFVFILFFTLFLFIQKLYRASVRCLKMSLRALRRMEKEGLIDATERKQLLRVLIVNFIYIRLNNNPRQIGQLEQHLKRNGIKILVDDFPKDLNRENPSDKKTTNAKKT